MKTEMALNWQPKELVIALGGKAWDQGHLQEQLLRALLIFTPPSFFSPPYPLPSPSMVALGVMGQIQL